MFDLSPLPIAALVLAAVAVALAVAARRGRSRRRAERIRPEYVWLALAGRYGSPLGLAFTGAETEETTKDTYRGAYLLLAARLRMELTMVEFFIEGGAFVFARQCRVVGRHTYSTEAFQPYLREIGSLEDFGRYAPYRGGPLNMMKLSVHPEDADEAVAVLERAGTAVEVGGVPQPWWHTHNFPAF